MQSGKGNARSWVLEYEPAERRTTDPLMGWTSSGDMKQQLSLSFDTKEEAIAYAERNGIAYRLSEPPPERVAQEVLFGEFQMGPDRQLDPLSNGPVAQLDRAAAF